MARFLPLSLAGGHGHLAGSLLFTALLALSARAQTPMAPTPAPSPAPNPTAASTPPAKPSLAPAPTTNAAIPAAPQDAMARYGKIIAPGDEVLHPLRLKLPGLNIGEIKVPRNDEFDMRAKLEALAALSDADIRAQLEQWPAYGKMNLRDEGALLARIQDFRDYRTKVTMAKAHDIGLVTLTPDQKTHFTQEYWAKRLQMDRDLAKQLQPIVAQREQKLDDELFREFSQASPGPVAQIPAPANKPNSPSAGPAPAPSAAKTTLPAAMIESATNSGQPVPPEMPMTPVSASR